MEHFLVEPGCFRLDGGAMFGIVPKPLWNKVAPADEHNRIDLALRLWLMKTSNRIVLVDTGIGDMYEEKFCQQFDIRQNPSPLEGALRELGIAPEEVTDLVLSHLHFDHAGGMGKKVGEEIQPLFPEARCHLHREHYEYSCRPTLRDKGSFHRHNYEPVIEYYRQKDRMVWHTGEEGCLLESLYFRCSHGHTPWLMHPYNDRFIYLADLIPTSHHVHIPWVMGYDISPGVTTSDKQKFLDFVLEKKLTIIFEHDPAYWGGLVEQNPEKRRYSCQKLFPAHNSTGYAVP